jgi:hypothetical protein
LGRLFVSIKGDKVVEQWPVQDQVGMLQQLGFMPAPTQLTIGAALTAQEEVSHGAGADDLDNLGNERPNQGDDPVPSGAGGQADRH